MEKPVCVNMLHGSDSGLVIRLALVQCSVMTGIRVFPRLGPYFSVYGVILYKCCL